MSFISELYPSHITSPLLTDKYHITTAYAYWLEGKANIRATFYVFAREVCHELGFLVTAGLPILIEVIERWQSIGFTDNDIEFLKQEKNADGKQLFANEFLTYLKSLKFKLKIEAAPEGTLFFPHEPIMRIEGSIIEAKLLESVALCILNGHCAYANQAVSQWIAVNKKINNNGPRGLLSVQGLRRGPTINAALESSRTLVMCGYDSTSTGIAAKLFDQKFAGTMDHAWVMSHTTEIEAFRNFTAVYPNNGILLVDTYDPRQGIENAIIVIKELRLKGQANKYGIRFDSGNILDLSKLAFRRFAEEGLIDELKAKDAKNMTDDELLVYADNASIFIAASDGIDAYKAYKLRREGGVFKAWGIGTAGAHPKCVGLVYKMSCIHQVNFDNDNNGTNCIPVMKSSIANKYKASNPGIINSKRFYNSNGILEFVLIYDERLGFDIEKRIVNVKNFNDIKIIPNELCSINQDHKPILQLIFNHEGNKITSIPEYEILTENIQKQIKKLPNYLQNRFENIYLTEIRYNNAMKKLSKMLNNKKSKITHEDIEAVVHNKNDLKDDVPVYLDYMLLQTRHKFM